MKFLVNLVCVVDLSALKRKWSITFSARFSLVTLSFLLLYNIRITHCNKAFLLRIALITSLIRIRSPLVDIKCLLLIWSISGSPRTPLIPLYVIQHCHSSHIEPGTCHQILLFLNNFTMIFFDFHMVFDIFWVSLPA